MPINTREFGYPDDDGIISVDLVAGVATDIAHNLPRRPGFILWLEELTGTPTGLVGYDFDNSDADNIRVTASVSATYRLIPVL